MSNEVYIIGTGSYVPENVVTNEDLVQAFGKKDAGWIESKLGIKQRRYFGPVDFKNGLKIASNRLEIDMAEKAARNAIDESGLNMAEIDTVIAVTCTPDYIHFSFPGIELHRRLGLSNSANAFHFNSGCGGAMQALGLAFESILSGHRRNILIVASNNVSLQFNSRPYSEGGAWLSGYLFGDGAGAMLLSSQDIGAKIKVLSTVYGTDGNIPLVTYPGGGNALPYHLASPQDFCYFVDGSAVKNLFAPFMQQTILALNEKTPFNLTEMDRFYLHQANYHLLKGFSEYLQLPFEKVAVNVDRYGNTSAAATLILFDEDRNEGKFGQGSKALFAAIGAGVHYGGALIQG